jgi:hypothetical protein
VVHDPVDVVVVALVSVDHRMTVDPILQQENVAVGFEPTTLCFDEVAIHLFMRSFYVRACLKILWPDSSKICCLKRHLDPWLHLLGCDTAPLIFETLQLAGFRAHELFSDFSL